MSAQEKALAEAESQVADLTEDERAIDDKTDGIAAKIAPSVRGRPKSAPPRRWRSSSARPRSWGRASTTSALIRCPTTIPATRGRARPSAPRDLAERLDGGDIGEAGAMAAQSERMSSAGPTATVRVDVAQGAGGAAARAKGSTAGQRLGRRAARLQATPGDSSLTPDEQKQLSELGKQQAAAKKRADELGGKLKKAGLPPSLGGRLERAGGHMSDAERRLSGKDAPAPPAIRSRR